MATDEASGLPLDKKALKAAKAAEKAAAKAAKAAEKEAAKVAKQEAKESKQKALNETHAVADGGKSGQRADKAAEKAKKRAEKELLKEQKKIEKAAKKQAKKGTSTVVIVGDNKPAVESGAWTDDVDEGSTVENGPNAVGSLVAADGATISKLAVTPLGGQSTPETAELVAFLNPVASVRNCWLQRRDKKCLVLYDHDTDSFLACARLVQNKVGRDQFWRIYRSPQAMTCDQSQLLKEQRLAYVGKLDRVLTGVASAPDKYTLFDQRTDTRCEHLLITLKKKKKAVAYKVRCPNVPDRIYRSTEPTYDKGTKVHTYPQMTLENTKESIKNFVLQLEGAKDSSQPDQPPPVEMGKRLDDEWDLRVRAPFSIYQAFGMAVTACYGT